MTLNLKDTRERLQAFEFRRLFVNALGWSQPTKTGAWTVRAKDEEYTCRMVSELAGVVVLEIESPHGSIPDAVARIAVQREIARQHHENLLIFVDASRTQSLWYWVKREDGKRIPREHFFLRGQPGDLFLSKLSQIVFDLSEFESGSVNVVEVARRLREALDVERVTKRFFTDFQREHLRFLEFIDGIADERQRRWYASVLLNRLMFVYFLQKKQFVDDGNVNYLQEKFAASQKRGTNLFYSEFLKALFFEGFAKPEEKRAPEVRALLGAIKYLNGGLFLPHRIELDNPDIRIADQAFANILALFDSYSWNLDDTPGGKDDEINPDVLGYIFEKYINQKAFGAYYTRPEITEYLCDRTIHRLVLAAINTPDVERRHPLPGVKVRQYGSVGDLLLDLDAELCRELLFEVLPGLTILDPACGSGAFLVAAMKTLINIYAAIIGKIKVLGDRKLSDWLAQVEKDHPSIGYFIKKRIIVENLYGVDLMEESAEIARLRLFLALVSSARTADDLEPLPNIDFNILPGNSLIGLMRVDDKAFNQRTAQSNMFYKSYRQVLDEKNALIDNYRKTSAYTDDLMVLRQDIEVRKRAACDSLDEILCDEFQRLGIKYEEATWDVKANKEGKPKKRTVHPGDIRALKPFHWGFEFDKIMNERGGFDAILTNPPWEILQVYEKEFFEQHSTLVSKKKMSILDFQKHRDKLMRDAEIRNAWLQYCSQIPHQAAYFKRADEYNNQIAIVNGKKARTDINLYKLFIERCFHLLREGGECGLVVPSGIYTDLGAKQLREMLFGNGRITGLFGFENRKEIFEGVHRSFKFVVLTFEKGGHTESFPAAFMRHDVEELAHFPRRGAVPVSVPFVRRLSPHSLSLLEFKSEIDVAIAEKMLKYPLLGEKLEDTWNVKFTQEFNMTTDSHLFKTSPGKGRLPLYEGKMIWQFDHRFAPPRYWIDEKEGRKALLGREEDRGQTLDYETYRLGFRDVAANTNERTAIASIIPGRVFAGNTLPVHIPSEQAAPSSADLVIIVAIFNSFAYDWLIRQRITNHLNFFYVYQSPMPRLTKRDTYFAPILDRAARLVCVSDEFASLASQLGVTDKPAAVTVEERLTLRAELEGLVAHSYGLTEEELAHVLGTFPIVSPSVKDAALASYRASRPKSTDESLAADLRSGESASREFKSSARWDYKESRVNKALELPILKTVAAFLNSDGGRLLIGVSDEGEVLGLQKDYQTMGKKQSRDAYENWLMTLLTDQFGKDIASSLRISFPQAAGKEVCCVDVSASARPVFIKDSGGEHLYIRAGNSSRMLSTKEAIDYCKKRWPSL